jgi:hypothetical protein
VLAQQLRGRREDLVAIGKRHAPDEMRAAHADLTHFSASSSRSANVTIRRCAREEKDAMTVDS